MQILFYIMAVVLVLSALGVVVAKNPIQSAMCLILNLITVAGIFAQLEAHFLAVVQIIVYAGAIMVLVLFVLMLLNTKNERVNKTSSISVISAVICGVAFLVLCIPLLNEAFSQFPAPTVMIVGTVDAIGKSLYTRYVFPFEAASVLIMAAIVGAVMVAKRRYR